MYGDAPEEARDNIRRSDKARAAYYRQISGKRWGAPDQYDLVVDSSCGVEASVAQILKELQTRGLVSRAQPESRPACAAGSRERTGRAEGCILLYPQCGRRKITGKNVAISAAGAMPAADFFCLLRGKKRALPLAEYKRNKEKKSKTGRTLIDKIVDFLTLIRTIFRQNGKI